MEYPLTKALAVATLGYSAWVVANPERLRAQIGDPPEWQVPAERLTRTWAGRDVPSALLALFGGSRGARAGTLLRVTGDLTDAVTLGTSVSSDATRRKVVAVTGGYAVLNLLALLLDERRRDSE